MVNCFVIPDPNQRSGARVLIDIFTQDLLFWSGLLNPERRHVKLEVRLNKKRPGILTDRGAARESKADRGQKRKMESMRTGLISHLRHITDPSSPETTCLEYPPFRRHSAVLASHLYFRMDPKQRVSNWCQCHQTRIGDWVPFFTEQT